MKIIKAGSEIYRQIKQTIFFVFGFRRWCFCFALSDHYLLKKNFLLDLFVLFVRDSQPEYLKIIIIISY